jgi:RND family efflux transporter MFP subunit
MNRQADSDRHDGPAPAADPPRLVTGGRLRMAAIVGAAIAVLVVLGGIVSRNSDAAAVARWTREQSVPTVTVIRPATAGIAGSIVLPGRVEAFYKAPIYARVSGYLKRWNTDIGARVRAGEVLAEIETPDLDQQLQQAQAELATARASEALAEITARRWQLMLKADSVSRQAADEKAADLQARGTIGAAASANVQRLQALAGFKRILAPFDGVVTARYTDVGALINAGSGTGPQLFTVSDIHSLRVYVSVPQDDAAAVHAGMTARLSVPERPGRTFVASVVSTAGAVEAESGTLLVELSLTGASTVVLPGDYANVELDLPAPADVVRIPATALIFKATGLQVATLDANDRVSLRTIAIKRDLGTWIEVASGLKPDDRVIDNPPEALLEGDEVQESAAPAAVPDEGQPGHQSNGGPAREGS